MHVTISWIYIIWDEHRLRMFENRVLRRVSAPKNARSDRKLEKTA
jgi:hypothetical protein